MQIFSVKLKIFRFEIKTTLFGYFGQQFYKTIVIPVSNRYSLFFQNAKFHAQLKSMSLAPKIPNLGIFRQNFEENYCHI